MPKADAIDALVEAAIRDFARYGYEGASLREIASEAGAPLSTIDRYFGSKEGFFRSVLRQVWSEVEHDRDVLLEHAREKNGGADPLVGDLIEALARPVVQRALSMSEGDVARTVLLRTVRLGAQRVDPGEVPQLFNPIRSLVRWIDAMQVKCPDLSRQDIVWVFSYLSGLIFSRQLIHH